MKEILREIGMIARALDSISNIEFKEFELTKGQYLYLVRICENRGIIQEKLAEMIKVDRTTAARAVQKLEINGFIEKKGDSRYFHAFFDPMVLVMVPVCLLCSVFDS